MTKYIYLALGGALGTFTRYFLSGFIHKFLGHNFPHGTLAVNLVGCFVIGILAEMGVEKLSSELRLFLMIGFCGALTTFSTFILETAKLFDQTSSLHALFNILISLALGIAVFRIGMLAVRWV